MVRKAEKAAMKRWEGKNYDLGATMSLRLCSKEAGKDLHLTKMEKLTYNKMSE